MDNNTPNTPKVEALLHPAAAVKLLVRLITESHVAGDAATVRRMQEGMSAIAKQLKQSPVLWQAYRVSGYLQSHPATDRDAGMRYINHTLTLLEGYDAPRIQEALGSVTSIVGGSATMDGAGSHGVRPVDSLICDLMVESRKPAQERNPDRLHAACEAVLDLMAANALSESVEKGNVGATNTEPPADPLKASISGHLSRLGEQEQRLVSLFSVGTESDRKLCYESLRNTLVARVKGQINDFNGDDLVLAETVGKTVGNLLSLTYTPEKAWEDVMRMKTLGDSLPA